MPSSPVMSLSRAATCAGCRGLSMTQGPAIRNRRPLPSLARPAWIAAAMSAGDGDVRGRRLAEPHLLVLERGAHEVGEERMRLQGLRLELRVVLHGHVPRVLRDLRHLHELAVGRLAGDREPALREAALVGLVELVAMAVPLEDLGRAVDLRRARAGLQLAGVR